MAVAKSPAAPPPSTNAEEDPLFMSATRLAVAIRQKRLSAREVTDLHIARIGATSPVINAVVATCFERARREADDLDARAARGDFAGPLHGVPMTVKDSFDTEGVVSTGGTLGRQGFIPGRDATVVARARAAGAILLGKTNTPEFTLGVGPKGTDNLVYGLTRNPYGQTYQPGASSGGSAANVAAGGAGFDIGSDVYGSIRDPSHACGVVGLKPTQGRLPRTGHIIDYGGLFDSFQQVGPIARRVEDLALLMPILNGPDDRDAACAPVPLGDPAAVDLSGLRVAFYPHNGDNPPSEEIQALVRACAADLEVAGCRVSPDMPPLMAELAALRGRYSSATGGYLMRTLLERAGTDRPYPGVDFSSPDAPSSELTAYAEELDAVRSAQLRWFQSYDVILCPASTRAALPLDREVPPPPTPPPGRPRRSPYYLGIYNAAGWPAGVVRAGTSTDDPGIPLGVQVIGRPWREDQVIAVLARIESSFGGYRRPAL